MTVRCGRLTTKKAMILAFPLTVAVLLVTGSWALGQSAVVKKASNPNGSNEPSPGADSGIPGSQGGTVSLRLAGTNTASRSLQVLYDKFRKEHPELSPLFRYISTGTDAGLAEFFAGRAQVAVIRRALNKGQEQQFAKAFPDPKRQPEEIVFGKSALVFVVHRSNPITALGYGQIENIYRGKITNWFELNGPNLKIERLGTMPSNGIFHRLILKGRRVRFKNVLPGSDPHRRNREAFHKALRELRKKYPGSGPFPRYRNDSRVVKEVAKKPNAIGYCILPPGEFRPKGVRLVPVIPPGEKVAVKPTRENVLFDKYPLQLTIKFLVRPDASQVVRDFIKFACSNEAAEIVRNCGLHPISEKEQILSAKKSRSL